MTQHLGMAAHAHAILSYRYIIHEDRDSLHLKFQYVGDTDNKWEMEITNEGKHPVVITCIDWVIGKRKKPEPLNIKLYGSRHNKYTRWPNPDINKIGPGRKGLAVFSIDDLKANLKDISRYRLKRLRIEFRTARRRTHRLRPDNDLLRAIKEDLRASAES